MKIELTVTLEDTRKAVAAYVMEKYGINVEPFAFNPQYEGEYDTVEFTGFKIEIDPNGLIKKS